MKTIYPYYLITILLLSFSNCKKSGGSNADNPFGLPNASNNGSMIFACRINGENKIAGPSSNAQNGNITNDSVTVFAGFGTTYFQRIAFIVYGNIILNNAYNFSDSMKTKFIYDSDSTCFGVFPNDFAVKIAFGSVTFTKVDSVHKIIAGTFAFKVPFAGCDTLNFTDGRFDIRYTN